MSASILMHTTCLGLHLTSYSGSHSRDIPVLFWGCVYTATDCPALPVCFITVDSGRPPVQSHPNMLVFRTMSVSGHWIFSFLHYPNSARFRETGNVGVQWLGHLCYSVSGSESGRPASVSSHSDAKILPPTTTLRELM